MKQVDKTHYQFGKYSHVGRWASYFYQLREILETSPQSVLEIGVGDKVVGNYLKDNTHVSYTSVDVAEDLKPDVVGSVLALPFKDSEFDVVCAFEVLEHIPFEQFEKAVSEMCRVAKKYILISLPHYGPQVKTFLKIPLVPEIKFAMKVSHPKEHTFNGEHYWEIGKKDYPVDRIKQALSKYGTVTKEFVPFENQYHHFFVVKK